MIIRFGKVVHHNDCTWCQLRLQLDIGTKSKKKIVEKCLFDNHNIPHPLSGDRYCEHYRQIGCKCNNCDTSANQLEQILDK